MTDDPDDLDKLLGSLAKSGGLRSAPDPEEHPGSGLLYAYHEGKLSPEERPRIEEHLSLCGRCRDLLVEYKPFLATPVGVADFGAAAERKKSSTADGGDRRRALRWAAGILVALAGISLYLVSRNEAPLGNEDTTTLSAEGSWKSRGAREKAFRLPERILLENPTPDTYPQYRVKIMDDRGQTAQVFEGLREVDYKVEVRLEEGSLPPGRYEAELSALENGAPRILGSFGFLVLPPN